MIRSRKTARRGLVMSASLLVATLASAGVYSSQAYASPAATKTKTTTTTFSLHCDAGIASGTVSVVTTQIYKASVAAGASFTIKWKSVTTVSGSLSEAAYALAPKGSEKGTVTVDNDVSTDATPATSNIAGVNGVPESGTISSASGFPITTPPTGYNVTPSFTAGTAGTDKIMAEDDDATVSIYNSKGTEVLKNQTTDCTPVGTPSVIATIKVTK
jgi:hypothetical protein